MICTAFCDLRADLRICLATLRKSVSQVGFANLRRLASPFGRYCSFTIQASRWNCIEAQFILQYFVLKFNFYF